MYPSSVSYFRSRITGSIISRAGALLLFIITLLASQQPVQALPAGFQQFYTPLPADTARAIFVNIDTDPVPSAGMHYVVGVTASADNTTVYYDHWENGFLTGAAGDEVVTLSKGQVRFFESSNIPTNPRGTATFYDGGDRIFVAGSLLQLVVSIWPETPGTVFTDAWEVYPVQAWTTNYTIPIGENLAASPTLYGDFTKVWAVVMAKQNGTTVTITDPGGAGLTTTINAGKTAVYEVKGVGATVTASQPVQVQLMTGRPRSGTNSEMRGYTLAPRTYWSNSYVAPVPGWSGAKMDLYLYNPNASPITITYTDRTGTGSVSLPAGATRSYSSLSGRTVPIGSGVQLTGTGVFWGIGAGDSGSPTWDWGYDLIPTNFLGTDNYVSWAPGTADRTANGSPVYVTALNDNTTVFVDYGPNDGVFDATYTVNKLQAIQIFDPDKDNTGMHIVSTNTVAVAWGESPDVAGTGSPYLDMGYTTLPLPIEWIDVALNITKTANPTAVNVGQDSTFTLVTNVPSTASGSATSVNIKDVLPPGWEYQVGSSTPSEPVVTGSVATGQILTWNLNATIPVGGNVTITFKARPTVSADTTNPNRNVASATGVALGATLTADAQAFVTVLTAPSVSSSKSWSLVVDTGDAGPTPGDTLEYVVTIRNTGNASATGVTFSDTVDPNTSVICSPSPVVVPGTVTSCTPTGLSASIGTLAQGATATVTFRVTIAGSVPAGVTAVSNQGQISGGNFPTVPTDDPAVGGATDPTVTPITATPRLVASKNDQLLADLDGDGVPSPGDQLRYSVTIANTGTSAATAVMFNDTPDGNTVLLNGSVTTSAGTVTIGNAPGDSSVAVNIGTLNGGSTVTVTFVVTIRNPLPAGITQVINQGVVSSSNYAAIATDDPDLPGNSDPTATPISAEPAIYVSKTDSLWIDADNNGVPSPADTLLYQITIVNNGNEAAQAVVVNDIVDPNTTLVVGTVSTSQGTVTSGNLGGDTAVAVDLGIIGGGGGTALISFHVQIASILPPGVTTVVNQATVSGGNFATLPSDDPDSPGNDEPTLTGVAATPILAASKTGTLLIDADNNGFVSAGDTLAYQITIANVGNQGASGVTYSDTPDALTPLEVGSVATTLGVVTSGNTVGETTVGVNIGTLPAQTTVVIAYHTIIGASLPVGTTQFVNQGTVASNELPAVLTDDPSQSGSSDPTIIQLALGQISGVVFNDLNGNGTQNSGEAALALVTITLLDSNGNIVATAQTLPDGSYTFGNLTPGAYSVVETDPLGYVSTTSNLIPVNVPPGGSATANFGDQQVGTVSGVVFNDLNGNGVQDPGEAGLGGVTIELTDGVNTYTTTTAGDGSYLFSGVVAGSYTVSETDPSGYTSTTNNSVPVSVPPGGSATANFGDQQVGTVSGVVFNDLNGNGIQEIR